jgi:TonB family protein
LRAVEHFAEFDIDPAPIWPVDDERLEPIFLAGPPGEETDEESEDAGAAPRPRASALSPLGSFCIHLATLLCLLGWREAPAEIADALPVQLVLEASAGPADAEGAPPVPDSETTQQLAAETAPPAADPAPAPPAPTPPVKIATAAPRLVKPTPPVDPASRPSPAPAANAAPSQAPDETSESDYLAHLVALTRGHLDLLPVSFLAGRHGHTTLSVVVRDDGTIGRIAVKRSSGHPDIDARIEQMVVAVGRFPPPPGSFQRPAAELDFNLTFPDALQ